MKWLVLLGGLLAFSAGAAGKKPKKPPAPPPPAPVLTAPSEKLAEAMGAKVAEQLTSGAKFEIARTSYTQGIRPGPDKVIGSDFQRETEWAELTPAAVDWFRAVFYDEKSFRLGANVGSCNFVPDVAFQVSNAGRLDTLQALVSFKCNQVLFFSVKTGGRAVPGMALDLKPGRKKLLELVKKLLPTDAVLRGLE